MSLFNVSLTLLFLLFFTTQTSSSSSSSTIPLTITLTPSPSSQSSPYTLSLTTTLKNTHPHSPLTLLTWSTPLDPLAPYLGVYTVTDTTTHTSINTHILAIRRAMPPPPDAFVQIDAGGSVDVEVRFDAARFEGLVQDRGYEVRADGWWGGVWEETKEVVLAEQGEEGIMAGGMVMGRFESEGVVVRVGGEDV